MYEQLSVKVLLKKIIKNKMKSMLPINTIILITTMISQFSNFFHQCIDLISISAKICSALAKSLLPL